MSPFSHFVLFFLMLYTGRTQTQITRDLTPSIPENLLLERNQIWTLINCTYDSKDDRSLYSQVVSDDYKGKWNQTKTSGNNKADQAEREEFSEYNSGSQRPTLVEALTKGHKHPMATFWALFAQLSAMSDFPDEDKPDESRKCSPRGTMYDSYLTLCPMCRVKTKLPQGHIPPYIDEVICENDNVPCFRKNGKCFQRYMTITAIRKIHGSRCLLTDQNGRQFWTMNWEIYDQKVRVSCECLIDKRSRFVNAIT